MSYEQSMANLAASQGRVATIEQDAAFLLLCPACGGAWTHVDTVVFTNAAEQVLTVSCCGKDNYAHMHTGNGEPPVSVVKSPRRHSISILVSCENCSVASEYSLTQHKGQTFCDVNTHHVHEDYDETADEGESL